MPQVSKYGFKLKAPRDLLEKLRREHDRFLTASDHRSPDHRMQSDHAFNFVITAWHLVDWLWNSASKSTPTSHRLMGCKSFEELHAAVRTQSPALQVCYELCLGAKHFLLHKNREKSVKAAAAVVMEDSGVTRSPARAVAQAVTRSPAGCFEEQLFVTMSDGKVVPAAEIFSQVLSFWDGVFLQHVRREEG